MQMELLQILDSAHADKYTLIKTLLEKLTGITIFYELRKRSEDTPKDELSDPFAFLKYGGDVGRIILKSLRYCKTSGYNGVIIDTDERKIICFPPKMLQNLEISWSDKMTIHKAEDGTLINLYFWDGKWNISTTKSFYSNEYHWIGEKTYQEIFDGFCEQYEIDMEQLDKSKSHTIGFKHLDFHPFKPENKMWYICSNNLGDMQFVDDGYLSEILPKQEMCNKMSKNQIKKLTNNALNEYINHGIVFYGFIIRHEDFNQPDIFVESSLMEYIRLNMYYKPPKSIVRYVNHTNRINYFIVKAYMNYLDNNIFLKLFPQFKKDFNECQNNIETIVMQCEKLLKNTIDISDLRDTPFDKFTMHIYRYICRNVKINKYSPNLRSIIRDCARHKKNINTYFRFFFTENQE